MATHLYEDLVSISRSPRLVESVLVRRDRVLNVQNRRRGVVARRGDGTFGQIIPGEEPLADPGYQVARGKGSDFSAVTTLLSLADGNERLYIDLRGSGAGGAVERQ